jgi:uncharacterized membrane protein
MNRDSVSDSFELGDLSFDTGTTEKNNIRANQETDKRSIVTIVERFEVAIRNGELKQAEKLLWEIDRKYEKLSANETEAVERSLLTRSHTELLYEQRTTLSKHSQQATATRLVRAVFMVMGSTFIADTETADTQAMLTVTERLKQSERAFKMIRKKAASVVADVSSSLPPAVAILSVQEPNGPIESGKSFNLTVVMKNIGDAPAKGVQLQIRGETGLQIDAPPAAVGVLDTDTTTTRDLTLTSERPGVHTLVFKTSSDNAGSAKEQVSVEVFDGKTSTTTQGPPGDQGEFAPLRLEDPPDWLPMAGGAGALGLGAGAYGYLKNGSDEQGENGR